MRTLFRTASQNSKVRSELTDVLDARPQIFALVPTGSGWRYTMKTSAIALSLWLLASPVGAQWPTFPTPGIPRTADGKPNLAAPAPPRPTGSPISPASGRQLQLTLSMPSTSYKIRRTRASSCPPPRPFSRNISRISGGIIPLATVFLAVP